MEHLTRPQAVCWSHPVDSSTYRVPAQPARPTKAAGRPPQYTRGPSICADFWRKTKVDAPLSSVGSADACTVRWQRSVNIPEPGSHPGVAYRRNVSTRERQEQNLLLPRAAGSIKATRSGGILTDG